MWMFVAVKRYKLQTVHLSALRSHTMTVLLVLHPNLQNIFNKMQNCLWFSLIDMFNPNSNMIVMPLEQQIISAGRRKRENVSATMFPVEIFKGIVQVKNLKFARSHVVIIIDLLTFYRTRDYSMHHKHEREIHR